MVGSLAGSFRSGERPPLVLPQPQWVERLERVDRAIVDRNVSMAVYEWREALGAALATRRWAPMAEVGDAALRVDTLLPPTGSFRREARRVYLSALFRARAERSLEGVQRVMEAFEGLGDVEAAQHARRIAAELS
jgi:hypothetical protein